MSLLSVEEVSVRFGGVMANQGVNLHADAGHITGLIGPNGAGKTTMFNVITGLQDPTEGRVLVDGKDVTGIDVRRRSVAMVNTIGARILARAFTPPHPFAQR